MLKKFGVYALIFHTDNGEKIYVGSTTVSFRERLEHHRTDLKRKVHHSTRVQRLWDKYKKFEFLVLEVCTDKESVISREQYHIDNTPPQKLVNFGPAIPAPFFGRKHSKEKREKMSKASKGRPNPCSRETIDRVIANLAQINKGREPWNKGRKLTPEEREKIKEGMKRKEVFNKMSAVHKGKTPWNKGKTGMKHPNRKPWTEESKKRLSEIKKGKAPYIPTEATKQKLSESLKQYWAKKRNQEQ